LVKDEPDVEILTHFNQNLVQLAYVILWEPEVLDGLGAAQGR
jgi:hypothetical protein